mgnify:CR=1 FL=1
MKLKSILKNTTLLCLLLSTTSISANDHHYQQSLLELDWVGISDDLGIPAKILYAVGLKESGKYSKSKFTPHPWAIGIGEDPSVGQFEHVSLYPDTQEEAETVLNDLLDAGFKNLGIGMMQISLIYHLDKVNKPTDLLNLKTNLNVSIQVIQDCQKRNSTVEAVLSCYSFGEGDDPNGQIYASETMQYANTYGKDFVESIIPKGPPVGELNENLLNSIWDSLDNQTRTQE